MSVINEIQNMPYKVYKVNLGAGLSAGSKSVPHNIPNFDINKVRNIRTIGISPTLCFTADYFGATSNPQLRTYISGQNIAQEYAGNFSAYNFVTYIEYDETWGGGHKCKTCENIPSESRWAA